MNKELFKFDKLRRESSHASPAGMALGFVQLLKGKSKDSSGPGEIEANDLVSKSLATRFNDSILPLSEKFEAIRQKKLNSASFRLKVSIVLFIVTLAAALIYDTQYRSSGDPVTLLVLFVVLLLAGWTLLPIWSFKTKIKQDIYPTIFDCLENMSYWLKGELPFDQLRHSGILPDYDSYDAEDYIQGEYKGVTIELCESHFYKIRQTESSTRNDYVGGGLFVLLSMKKRFEGQTIIDAESGIFGKLTSGHRSKKLETIKLEDPVFEKKYEVYGSNQIESRYLLTTSFMERYLALEAFFGKKPIKASFFEQKVLLMINAGNKNFFEPSSIFNPIDFRDDLQQLLEEIKLIYDIIDTLKLNQNIGL